MKHQLRTVIYTVAIIALSLSACDIVSTSTIYTNFECIPPPVKEVPVEATVIPKQKQEIFLPLGDWQPEVGLPKKAHNLLIRSDEFWITSNYVYKYRLDIEEWQAYATVEGVNAVPDELFLAHDGSLWGFGLDPLGNTTKELKEFHTKDYPLLSRYNEAADQFEFVRDRNGILNWQMAHTPLEMEEDQNNLFWMILKEGNRSVLYSFDPGTLQAQLRLALQSSIDNLAVAPDGSIWLTYNSQLIRYDPITGETYPYQEQIWPDDLEEVDPIGFQALYFDRQGRLWIEDRGWLDFSQPDQPVWHKIERSSVFIDLYDASLAYESPPKFSRVWMRPWGAYQSSNGLLWFQSTVGMVRFDPEKDEWCHFTTEFGPIAEDSDHNLWLAADGYLYKLRLMP